MKRLALITTHPIQYNAPLFRLISERGKTNLKVFYTWSQALEKFEDPDFGQSVQWDIPLLEGYDWEAINNIAKKPSSKSFYGVDNPELIAKIKAFNPDAILVFGWNHKSHLQVMRHFKDKIPIWFRGDSTLLDYDYKTVKDLLKYYGKYPFTFHLSPFTSYLKFKLRTLFLRWIYSYVDKAFYVGTHNKNYYLHHGLTEEQLIYAPHAVDNERFFDNEKRQYEINARQWRRELGIPDEAKVILFAGKFEPKKNPGILIDAIIQLNEQQSATSNQQLERSEIPNLRDKSKTKSQEFGTANQQPATRNQQPAMHLILVGAGKLENELHNKTSNKSYIHFLPFQNQSLMPIVYRLGDIFCLPSQGPGETWGLAINEAMASDRLVIASNKCGGAIDLLNDQHIFNPLNFEDLMVSIKVSLTGLDIHGQKVNRRNYTLESIASAFDRNL